jgi:hypothetical protein
MGNRKEALGAAIAATVPVKNGFYPGAEAGIHSSSYFIDHTITATQSTAEFRHRGYYEVNQFQVFLVPEYRFLKDDLLFIKGGLGICKDFNARFTNGLEIGLGTLSSDLVGRSYPRQIAAGGFIGGGLQIQLVKRLGLKLEGRYTVATHGAESDDQIIYRFNYWSAVGGLTFTL